MAQLDKMLELCNRFFLIIGTASSLAGPQNLDAMEIQMSRRSSFKFFTHINELKATRRKINREVQAPCRHTNLSIKLLSTLR